MSTRTPPSDSIPNSDLRQYHSHGAGREQLLCETGHRVPRPAGVPRTAFQSRASTAETEVSGGTFYTVTSDSDYLPGRTLHPLSLELNLQPSDGAPRSSQGQHSYGALEDMNTRWDDDNVAAPVSTLMSGIGLHSKVEDDASVPAPTAEPSAGDQYNNSDNAAQAVPPPFSQARHPGGTLTASRPWATTVSRDGIVSARNEENQVQTVVQTESRERITDPALAQAGIWARSLLLETPGDVEQLFDSYRRRDTPRKYFIFGRVFFVLWAEPHGDSSTVTTWLEPGTSLNAYGAPVYSKARRFVVVREADDYCTCLPIVTYQGQGVAKRGVKKSDHSIIYTTKTPPPARREEIPQRGEEGMQPDAIRVNVDDPSDKLPSVSRLDYGKTYTIHHNLKVKNVGVVNPNSKDAFLRQFNNVWTRPRNFGSSGLRAIGEPGSSRGGNASDAPAPLRQEEGRRIAVVDPSSPQQGSRKGIDSHKQGREEASRLSKEQYNDEGSSSDDAEETGDAPEPTALEASAHAAMQRMIARGFTSGQAAAAIRRETKRLSQRRPTRHNDNEQSAEASSSDDDHETEVRSDLRSCSIQLSPPHQARRQNSSHAARPIINSRQRPSPPVVQISQKQSGELGFAQSQQQARQPPQTRPYARQTAGVGSVPSQQVARQTPSHEDLRQTFGTTTGNYTTRGTQPLPSGAVQQSMRDERAEQAVQRLIRQGYSREQAIAIVRSHVDRRA